MADKKGILINPHTGAEHEYTLAHAWAIMDMQRNGGWQWKGTPPPRPATAQATDEDCGCNDKQKVAATDAYTGSGTKSKAGGSKTGAQKSTGKGQKA